MTIRFILVLTSLGLLAACGADGAPDSPTPGVAVHGEAKLGVTSKL